MASWFRSWHGAPTDNKWLVIAKRAQVQPGIVSAIAWALLDYASQADERGSVKDFDVETYATFSGFEESAVNAVITAMQEKGVIGPDGRLTAWDRRQPKREDDSAERVKEYRKRKRNVSQGDGEDVTQCNAESRSVTHGNNTDTDTDIETTTLTGATSAPADSSSLAAQFHLLNEELKTTRNRPAKLAQVYALCFGQDTCPDFAYLGKVAKSVGGAGRLAELMFELVPRPPTGDVLAYIVAQESGRKKRAAQTGGNREIKDVQFNNGTGNIYD